MNAIETIRAEIERRISKNTFGAKLELIDILAWLDQLPAQPVPAEESEPKNWPADKDNLVGKQAGESVDRWVVTNAFLKCDRAGKIVSEMYGDKLNNSRNRDKYLAFLQQVNLDDRFGELAGILQKYGAMPAPKEQPEVAGSLRDETGRLYEDIDTPIQHYAEEHFDYDSEWDSLTPKGGRPFSPADLEAAILFGYNLNPKHK